MHDIPDDLRDDHRPTPIRILIADDQALVRRGMTLLLALEDDMQVVGEASNGVEAVALARLLQPDVVLMDLHMPQKSGVIAIREIKAQSTTTQVLVLTTLDDDETIFEAVQAGARAYLLKDASEADLLETIRAVQRGESRMTPTIARKVMDQFRHLATRLASVSVSASSSAPTIAPASPMRPAANGAESLTEKESRILALVVEGCTNRQIANTVYLAEGTVKNYVSRIMEKLHASTRTELAILALRRASDR